MSLYTQVKKILNESGCRPRKRFGQNFLIDRNILDYIAKSINPQPQDTVIEIGAGTGILTYELSESPANVIAIEIDEGLFEILISRFADKDNVNLIKDDILTINLSDIVELNSISHQNPIKVVGNLPYYITTPILMKILDESFSLPIKEMLVMVQKEVGERIAASPGTKEYGALSVAIA
ncbi:16S rRNA (adenine(1518)-N(6)/adenine(1519)-N(6))-dimethyltransferase, partial [Candidatus Poribacteria bacterium]|nr:16S rRNA (adenine(1518)-N(6)/adenine(1519)-N(6))-dimethyltransferase [Candidatus Poribacteria bacterium]